MYELKDSIINWITEYLNYRVLVWGVVNSFIIAHPQNNRKSLFFHFCLAKLFYAKFKEQVRTIRVFPNYLKLLRKRGEARIANIVFLDICSLGIFDRGMRFDYIRVQQVVIYLYLPSVNYRTKLLSLVTLCACPRITLNIDSCDINEWNCICRISKSKRFIIMIFSFHIYTAFF